MSGGYFDYKQETIKSLIEEMEEFIENNPEEVSEMVLLQVRENISHLKESYVYTKRLDWYLSGDDSEETFSKKLGEELKVLGNE